MGSLSASKTAKTSTTTIHKSNRFKSGRNEIATNEEAKETTREMVAVRRLNFQYGIFNIRASLKSIPSDALSIAAIVNEDKTIAVPQAQAMNEVRSIALAKFFELTGSVNK